MALNNFSFDETTTTYIADVIDVAPAKYELEIGDLKSPDKFFPQMKWKMFNNECNFSVRLYSPVMGSVFELDNGKVKWVSPQGAVEVYMYEVETNPLLDSTSENDFEFGGCEFEAIYNEKPEDNVILFTVKSKNIKAWYQGEPDADSYRPDHVIGSYAIYHSNKSNNEYGCGKLFHIYRPKVIDSTGAEAWCELFIDTDRELMSITIPQDFLDNATYPIKLDPTAGYTGTGATAHGSVNWAISAIASKVTTPNVSTVPVLFTVKCRATASATYGFKAFICDSDSNLISSSATFPGADLVRNTATSLQCAPKEKITLSADTTYYLCATSSMPSASTNAFYYDSAAANTSILDSGNNSYTTPESIQTSSSLSRIYTIWYIYFTEYGIGTKNKLVTYTSALPGEPYYFQNDSTIKLFYHDVASVTYNYGLNEDYAFIYYCGLYPAVGTAGQIAAKHYTFTPYLNSSGNLVIDRYEAPNNSSGFWNISSQVICDTTNGQMFSVKRGDVTLAASGSDTTAELNAEVNISRSLITTYARCNEDNEDNYYSDTMVTAEFIDSTHIKFKRIDNTIAIKIYWEVVTFTASSGITVDSVEIDTSGDQGSALQSNTSLTFNYKYSLLLTQYRTESNLTEGRNICVYTAADNTISYRRYDSTTSYSSYLKVWVIKFPTTFTNIKSYEATSTLGAGCVTIAIDSTAYSKYLQIGSVGNFNYWVSDSVQYLSTAANNDTYTDPIYDLNNLMGFAHGYTYDNVYNIRMRNSNYGAANAKRYAVRHFTFGEFPSWVHKLNGISNATISKINGVSLSNTSKVIGV